MVDLVELILLFINVFATMGIVAVLAMWIHENQGLFDKPKSLILYIAPPVVVSGLMIGMGYANETVVFAVGITAAVSAVLFNLRQSP